MDPMGFLVDDEIVQLPESPKKNTMWVTTFLHLKTDGWNTIVSFWVPSDFQGRTGSFREGKECFFQ